MSLLLDGIGAMIKKVTQWIPGQTESLRNERERLINERSQILSKGQYNTDDNHHVAIINLRLSTIETKLSNKASD